VREIALTKDKKLESLRQECIKLFESKEDIQGYRSRVQELEDQITRLGLNSILEPTEFEFVLSIEIGNKLPRLSRKEFVQKINDYLRIKRNTYFFQLTELEGFPETYGLGHGSLLSSKALPEPVRVFAEHLARGEIMESDPHMKRLLEEGISKIIIPSDPHVGHWLRIITSAVSSVILLHRAFELAEESIDILRIATPTTRILLPKYAIGLDTDKDKAFLAGTVEFARCPYHLRKQPLIDRLNEICANPSSDLEKRIKNALHFMRIGDIFSPDYQRIFYYVAAIENLVLGSNDRDVLRWKFSEKGSILLTHDVKRRIALSRRLRKLYDARSKIAHGEETEYDFHLTTESRNHLANLITKILFLIDSEGIGTVSPKARKRGSSLDEYLDNIIYMG